MSKKDLSSFKITSAKSGLVIVDVQEKLTRAIIGSLDLEEWELTERSILNLIHLAKLFEMPIFLSEQYPKGLGATWDSIQKALDGTKNLEKNEKVEFSCWANGDFRENLKKHDLDSVIVTGMETHICVYQTVLDLLEEGYNVFVPNDGVISRKAMDLAAGLDLMEQAGARVTSTEALIFQVLQKAGTPEFKEMSQRIK